MEIEKIITSFNELKVNLEKELPYQINLIDELHVNENAHSRILTKILGYNKNRRYPYIESFFKYLGGDFENIQVQNPKLTDEKYRIDSLIKDNNYAVIIENKINGATDQKEQIERYVEKTSFLKGIDINNTYVLYLTQAGGSPSPDSNSLSEELSQNLSDRYKEINYKDDILPWLKEYVLPNCKVKDALLISAIGQYIDYLDGMFLSRENEAEIQNQLNSFILKELHIDDSNVFKKIKQLNKTIKIVFKLNDSKEDKTEIKNIDAVSFLESLKKIHKEEIINLHNNWFKRLRKDCPNAEFGSSIFNHPKEDIVLLKNIRDTYLYFGIKINYQNSEALCAIGFDKVTEKPYYGITFRSCENETKSDTISTFVKNELKDFKFISSTRWYGYKSQIELENIFDEFQKFYKIVLQKLN